MSKIPELYTHKVGFTHFENLHEQAKKIGSVKSIFLGFYKDDKQ